MAEQARDPLQAWPIIDGPMQSQNWAHADDYFYGAEVVLPGRSQPSGDPGANIGTGRTKYRLHRRQSGGYV
ncbi:hypothetical protein [Pseudomonas fluorescens]|uniref:Uncharacterized protein n=1 Tax=Pseudomonas fluorescens TaxID=294 RepID=A0A5E7P4E3_PSEFL|nr:hypothetical protein [Pseudomonas fluorescens]VVP44251.1 hypothetical protein PS880_05009 [Pseudomonas fluorescens]